MSRISVIIPTYNRVHLLNRAIQSVLKQTFQPHEIIIVDDASTDDTEKIVTNFPDKRIRYICHYTNKGGAAARNTGLQHARYEYIAFLDSDDEWLPGKLEKQLQIFVNAPHSLGVVYTDYEKKNWKKSADFQRYSGNISSRIIISNFVGTTSTPLIKRTCFEKSGVFDESLPSCQDWDMWIRIAHYYEFYFLNEVLVFYYHQLESISMDRKATNEGMRSISKKHKNQIKYLPHRLRAEHFFYMGKNYWWKRNIFASTQCMLKATLESPSLIPWIIDFLFIKKWKKLWRAIW